MEVRDAGKRRVEERKMSKYKKDGEKQADRQEDR